MKQAKMYDTLCKIRDADIKANIAEKHKTEKHKFQTSASKIYKIWCRIPRCKRQRKNHWETKLRSTTIDIYLQAGNTKYDITQSIKQSKTCF